MTVMGAMHSARLKRIIDAPRLKERKVTVFPLFAEISNKMMEKSVMMETSSMGMDVAPLVLSKLVGIVLTLPVVTICAVMAPSTNK